MISAKPGIGEKGAIGDMAVSPVYTVDRESCAHSGSFGMAPSSASTRKTVPPSSRTFFRALLLPSKTAGWEIPVSRGRNASEEQMCQPHGRLRRIDVDSGKRGRSQRQ